MFDFIPDKKPPEDPLRRFRKKRLLKFYNTTNDCFFNFEFIIQHYQVGEISRSYAAEFIKTEQLCLL